MGRGGNEELLELAKVRQQTLPFPALRADLQEEILGLEELLESAREERAYLVGQDDPRAKRILAGQAEKLKWIEQRLDVRKAVLRSLDTPDPIDYQQAHERYLQQGAAVWDALSSDRRLRGFRKDVDRIKAQKRDGSKAIESAFLVDLPEYLMVTNPDGRKKRATIHTAEIHFDGRRRQRSKKYPMKESFWADLIVEVDKQMFPFEFKAGEEKGTPSDFMGIGETAYVSGAPMNAAGTAVEKAQSNRYRHMGQALFAGFSPDGVRDLGIIAYNKTSGHLEMNFLSHYDLLQSGRINSKAGLQMHIADFKLLDRPMSLRLQGSLLAYCTILQQEKQMSLLEQSREEVMSFSKDEKERHASGAIPTSPTVSGPEAAKAKLDRKPRSGGKARRPRPAGDRRVPRTLKQ